MDFKVQIKHVQNSTARSISRENSLNIRSIITSNPENAAKIFPDINSNIFSRFAHKSSRKVGHPEPMESGTLTSRQMVLLFPVAAHRSPSCTYKEGMAASGRKRFLNFFPSPSTFSFVLFDYVYVLSSRNDNEPLFSFVPPVNNMFNTDRNDGLIR